MPVEPGIIIVNMDIFEKFLVLYERKAVSPKVRVFQMPLPADNEVQIYRMILYFPC